MAATILDGKALAKQIREQVTRDVADFNARHGTIKLCAVLVGTDAAGRLYAESQRKLAVKTGVDYKLIELPETATQDEVAATIEKLNADASVTGIILQMPLPAHLDAPLAQWRIDPYKDVEGVNPANIGLLFYNEPIIAPCTALAVVEMIKLSGAELRGMDAVVVGQSQIVGRPVTMFLLHNEATVTGTHIATRDLAAHTRRADLLVVAVGKAGLISREHIKPGAIVIDVGINSIQETQPDGSVKRRTVGDVVFDDVVDIAGAVSPVPGGVGPVTVAMLMRNTIEAARKQVARR